MRSRIKLPFNQTSVAKQYENDTLVVTIGEKITKFFTTGFIQTNYTNVVTVNEIEASPMPIRQVKDIKTKGLVFL